MDFGDGLKKIVLAGIGAAAATTETARDLVNHLVEKGEITVEQGKVLNEELRHRAKEKMKEHVTVNTVKTFDDTCDSLDEMTEEELDILKARIEEAKAKKQKDAEE